jgi:hypothetical protein
MPILLLLLLVGVLAYFYWRRRTTTLTRNCRWREDRAAGEGFYRCVSCGGQMRTKDSKPPRDCVAQGPRNSR